MLKKGEKIHIVERRYFPEDIRRHFCGEVVACSDHLLRAKGYIWVQATGSNQFTRKRHERERIFNLSDRLTINLIDPDVIIEEIHYAYDRSDGHYATDGKGFMMNISEFGIIS